MVPPILKLFLTHLEHEIFRETVQVSNLPEQRKGVLGFMFFSKPPKNSAQILLLFKQASKVLELSNHCKTMDEFERRDLYWPFSQNNYFDSLKEVLKADSSVLQKIICE